MWKGRPLLIFSLLTQSARKAAPRYEANYERGTRQKERDGGGKPLYRYSDFIKSSNCPGNIFFSPKQLQKKASPTLLSHKERERKKTLLLLILPSPTSSRRRKRERLLLINATQSYRGLIFGLGVINSS